MGGDSAALPDCTFSEAARQGPVENIIIEVGPTHVRYNLPKILLVHHSEYFRKALTGPWIESDGKPITLDDVHPAVFNIFVDWLYRQQLPEELKTTAGKEADELESPNRDDLLMIMLYVFADRFMVPSLYISVNQTLTYDPTDAFCADAITFAFNNLPTEDPILRLMVDSFFCKRTGNKDDETRSAAEVEWLDGLPRDFLVKVMQKARSLVDKDLVSIGELSRCDYHGHKSAEEREKCEDRDDK